MLYDGFHKINLVEMPDGSEREQFIIADGVAMLLVDNEGKFAMVKQYRAPIGEYLYEIPAGMVDKDGLSKIEIMMEEIEEECNFSKDMISKIDVKVLIEDLYIMSGSSYTKINLYLGKYDGVGVDTEIKGDEDVVALEWKDLAKNLETYEDVKHDMKSLMALTLYKSILHFTDEE